jgi:hypothetical protein
MDACNHDQQEGPMKMNERVIVASVKPLAAFLKAVNKAADDHWQDVQQARKEVPVEAQARRMHLIHWADCHPKETKIGLYKYAAKQAEEKAVFIVGVDKVNIRNGRTGTIVRVLIDGRYMLRVDCPLLYWEFYSLADLIGFAKARAAQRRAA